MKTKSEHDPMQTIATMLGYGAKSFERTRMSTDACDPNYRLRVAAFDGLCHLTEEGMTSNAPTAQQLSGPPRRFFVMTEEEAKWLHGALGEVLEEYAKHEARENECQVPPAVAINDEEDMSEDDESNIIVAGRQVPFVQVGMIVHPNDCLNCERDGNPLWCSALVCDIHDDEETARLGMMATLLFRNGERREEPCDELRRRWRMARDFDQSRVYTGRWGATPRGSVWPVAEVNEEA